MHLSSCKFYTNLLIMWPPLGIFWFGLQVPDWWLRGVGQTSMHNQVCRFGKILLWKKKKRCKDFTRTARNELWSILCFRVFLKIPSLVLEVLEMFFWDRLNAGVELDSSVFCTTDCLKQNPLGKRVEKNSVQKNSRINTGSFASSVSSYWEPVIGLCRPMFP